MNNTLTKKELTLHQKIIIEYESNLVVLAKPGSGKTFTISEKIKLILKSSLEFRGVIAISYTNKASKELRKRVLNGGVNKKRSFFDTMTTFYLMEIIYPFGCHLFGKISEDYIISGNYDTNPMVTNFRNENKDINYNRLSMQQISQLGEFYRTGILLLESIDALAVHIFDNSIACRRYLRSRYTHIFIDEYQDCGYMQNELFIRLVDEGLIGIAVGDKDQSIYGFAGKDSSYLMSLASDSRFMPFYLEKNFRCNKTISDYSLKLLNDNFQMKENEDIRVIHAQVQGKEDDIARFIDLNIPKLKIKYGIENNNQLAVLVKSNKTGKLVSESLKTKHKFFKPTDLDDDSSLWASVFKNLLINVQSSKTNTFELAEEYYNSIEEEREFKKLYSLIQNVKNSMELEVDIIVQAFIKVANMIFPKAVNSHTISKLKQVLVDQKSVESFAPAADDEVQIMTLHKSKGLEFSVVFHLNLHKYILPEIGPVEGVWVYKNYEQCKNLHYVGITRAEDICILVTSTKRTNFSDDIKNGEPSEFFYVNGLKNYSKRWTDFQSEL